MHIVEQAAQGLQRRLHGLAEHMVGPEMLAREALRQALDRWRLALDPWRPVLDPWRLALDPWRRRWAVGG